jgi:hypothetical protein
MAKWSKTKAPGTQMSQGRSFEQPSPEGCSQPAYVLTAMLGMARMGYCENLSLCDSAEDTIRLFFGLSSSGSCPRRTSAISAEAIERGYA